MTIFGTALPAVVPDDFEAFFVDGVAVDRRSGRPMEMDACNLYLGLRALELRDGSDFRELRERLVDAVLARIEACGGLPEHVQWRDRQGEVHMRMTSAVVRLLVDAHRDGLLEDRLLVTALLERHLGYREELMGGTLWFLHDSFEGPQPPGPHPRRLAENRLYGSSRRNTLTLNTHVDTLVTIAYVLRLHSPLSARERSALEHQLFLGVDALMLVLRPSQGRFSRAYDTWDAFVRRRVFDGYRPGVRLGKLAGRALERTYFPVRQQLKSCFPIVHHSDGYLERDLALQGTAFNYHVTNVWDLARLVHGLDRLRMGANAPGRLTAMVDHGLEHAFGSAYRHFLKRSYGSRGWTIQLCEVLATRFGAGGLLEPLWVRRYAEVRRRLPPSPALLGFDPVLTDPAVSMRALLEPRGSLDAIPVEGGRIVAVNWGDTQAEVRLRAGVTIALHRSAGEIRTLARGLTLEPWSAAILEVV